MQANIRLSRGKPMPTAIQIGLGPVGKFYVYFLRYPTSPIFGLRSGTVFYVGKGTNNRMSAHEREARSHLGARRLMKLKHKHKVIIEIISAGFQVVGEVQGRTDDENLAYQMETYWIDAFGLENLTNETYGHRPLTRRRRAA